jgi:3-oxoadipate enol-lactonase
VSATRRYPSRPLAWEDARRVILAHAIDGPDDGPALVLVGSLGTEKSMWRPQVAGLAGPLRLVRLDVRGHGDSPVPDGPYTIEVLAGDVLDTMDALGLERVSYAGLSIGGMIGLWLGAHAAERIDRLVLLFTGAVPADPASFIDRARQVREAGSPADLVDQLLPRWLTEPYRAEHPEVADELRAMVSACPPEGYAGCAEAIGAMDQRGLLSQITPPTLVISGAQDGSIPPELGREIAEAVPDARFELLDPAGHLGNIERADEVNSLIRQHLEVA